MLELAQCVSYKMSTIEEYESEDGTEQLDSNSAVLKAFSYIYSSLYRLSDLVTDLLIDPRVELINATPEVSVPGEKRLLQLLLFLFGSNVTQLP